jgi:hypothetical protein
VRFFATGHAKGTVQFWAINSEETGIEVLETVQLTATAIRRIAIEESAFAAIADELFCLCFAGRTALKRSPGFAVECAICASPIESVIRHFWLGEVLNVAM